MVSLPEMSGVIMDMMLEISYADVTPHGHLPFTEERQNKIPFNALKILKMQENTAELSGVHLYPT